jgi:hypothetical protein
LVATNLYEIQPTTPASQHSLALGRTFPCDAPRGGRQRLGRLSDLSSAPGLRTARRRIRRWLSANGLTLLVVSAMMAIA